jgi:branched-chain amino acid aminotransferase
MSTRVSIDGRIGDAASAKISVLDRGFLYGDSVYEVLRTYAGVPFCLEEHLGRLERSAELLGIRLPVDRAGLSAEIGATLDAASNAESYVRVIVTRGAGEIGLDPALAEQPLRVIIVRELRTLPDEIYRRGAAIRLVPAGRAGDGAVPLGAKSGNYLVNIMALGVARRAGAHEAVLLDARGRVTEGASSNIFTAGQGRLRTPPLSAGILQGITREKVLATARAAGLPVTEEELWPEDLFGAEEVFLTSTLREILPVTRVDERTVGDGQAGPVTKRLRALFRELTGSAER